MAHVYDYREMSKEKAFSQLDFPKIDCNYLCISNWKEWEPAECITSVFQAIHSKIGELLYAGKDPRWLKKEGIFFYKYEYILPKRMGSCGYLKEIPLPSLNLLEWPHVDESSASSFRYKLFFRNANWNERKRWHPRT